MGRGATGILVPLLSYLSCPTNIVHRRMSQFFVVCLLCNRFCVRTKSVRRLSRTRWILYLSTPFCCRFSRTSKSHNIVNCHRFADFISCCLIMCYYFVNFLCFLVNLNSEMRPRPAYRRVCSSSNRRRSHKCSIR